MTKPHTTIASIQSLPFEQRVSLVAEEVKRRKLVLNPANPSAFVTGLWVRWILRNALSANNNRGGKA